jgi:rhodanese-related sulfurtransferase
MHCNSYVAIGAEALALACISVAVVAALCIVPRSGYLGDIDVVHAIQDRHIADLERSIGTGELEDIVKHDAAVVVDARRSADFAFGHIPQAISVPADATATPARIREVFAQYSRTTPIVLYCQSAGCAYDEFVARLLYNEGYCNLRFLDGGWVEWQRHHTQGGQLR